MNTTIKSRLILVDQGKILLLKQTKPNGGNYTLVGGTVESKEFARATLVRESYEEAGVILKEEDLQLVHVLHKRTKDSHRIVFYFKAYKWSGELRAREKDKFLKAEWFSTQKLPKNLTATVRQVLDEYRDGNTYSEQMKK
jgi:ADP-ribose pyrophosphatase YjhB (NUDIX family)